jgi:hypothetical protein
MRPGFRGRPGSESQEQIRTVALMIFIDFLIFFKQRDAKTAVETPAGEELLSGSARFFFYIFCFFMFFFMFFFRFLVSSCFSLCFFVFPFRAAAPPAFFCCVFCFFMFFFMFFFRFLFLHVFLHVFFCSRSGRPLRPLFFL